MATLGRGRARVTALGTCPAARAALSCGSEGLASAAQSGPDTAQGVLTGRVNGTGLCVLLHIVTLWLSDDPRPISLIWALLCSSTGKGDRGICGPWDTMDRFWENKFSKEETVCGKWGGSAKPEMWQWEWLSWLCLKIIPCCLSLLGPLAMFWFEGHL